MKKTIFAVAVFLCGVISSYADNDVVVQDMKQLPSNAQTFVKQYFADLTFSYLKIDKELFEATPYEVNFADGSKIDFDKNGVWQEIDCKSGVVPAVLVPEKIASYVAAGKSAPVGKIVKIERTDRSGYEIKLDNGLVLEFDQKCKFVRIDD